MPLFLKFNADCWVDGVNRTVYLINDQLPGPLIDVEEGDELEVFVTNQLPVDNTIHWHGKKTNLLINLGGSI